MNKSFKEHLTTLGHKTYKIKLDINNDCSYYKCEICEYIYVIDHMSHKKYATYGKLLIKYNDETCNEMIVKDIIT